MALQGFTFNGTHSSNYFIVNSIHRDILPPLQQLALSVPGRGGAYDFGAEVGSREFKINVTLIEDTQDTLNTKLDEIAAWLLTEEPAPLKLDKEPDRTYYARLVADSGLSELGTYGTATLTFNCPDPYGYGEEVTETLTGSPTTVTVGGNVETYPIIKATLTQPTTHFAVATSYARHVLLGQAPSTEGTAVPKNELVFNDQMSDTSTWTTAPPILYGGTIAGSYYSDGQKFMPNTYGTGTGWHGPALQKALPSPVQDFRFEGIVGFGCNNQDTRLEQMQIGRIQLYLLDQNNQIIGLLSIRDAWGTEVSMVEAWVGNPNQGYNNQKLIEYIGVRKKGSAKVKVKTSKGYTYQTVVTESSTYSDFYGMLRLERIGRNWTAYVGKIDPITGKHHTRTTVKFYDKNNQFQNQLASVVVHSAQYATKPFATVNYITSVQVFKINQVTEPQVPYIGQAGDVIEIDCNAGAVYKNGEPAFDLLDPTSEWFSFYPNVPNKLAYTPSDVATVEVIKRNRWL